MVVKLSFIIFFHCFANASDFRETVWNFKTVQRLWPVSQSPFIRTMLTSRIIYWQHWKHVLLYYPGCETEKAYFPTERIQSREGRFTFPSQSYAGDWLGIRRQFIRIQAQAFFVLFFKPSFVPLLGTIEFIGSWIYCLLLLLLIITQSARYWDWVWHLLLLLLLLLSLLSFMGKTHQQPIHHHCLLPPSLRKQSDFLLLNCPAVAKARWTSKQRMPGIVVLRKLRPRTSYSALSRTSTS